MGVASYSFATGIIVLSSNRLGTGHGNSSPFMANKDGHGVFKVVIKL
jgi:hypothetical protein